MGCRVGESVIGTTGDLVGKREETLVGGVVGTSERSSTLGAWEGGDDTKLGSIDGTLETGKFDGDGLDSLGTALGNFVGTIKPIDVAPEEESVGIWEREVLEGALG